MRQRDWNNSAAVPVENLFKLAEAGSRNLSYENSLQPDLVGAGIIASNSTEICKLIPRSASSARCLKLEGWTDVKTSLKADCCLTAEYNSLPSEFALNDTTALGQLASYKAISP